MCGICGYILRKKMPEGILAKMNDRMFRRGPDDSGVWEKQYEQKAIGLAHRRLSILDLSDLGHQPMFSKDGKVAVVFNGEIYNFIDIRKELIGKGYKFISDCDTEVVVYSYIEWGKECFSKFNGMFAIAIWDQTNDCMILARDRIGKKPLYYYWKDNILLFASELKPFMECPVFRKQINDDVIGKMLCNKYIESPDTIFKDTFKVIPGTYVVINHSELTIKRYWKLIEIFHKNKDMQIEDYYEAKEHLAELLFDSVKKRMIADVEVGAFLSGGIDSALVTAVAQSLSEKKVESFSIGFYDKVRNEAPYSEAIAKHLGTKHTVRYMDDDAIISMLGNLPEYFDEPFSDSSQLPAMLVSKIASNHVSVALSGDGGDELFCGYKMYDWTWIVQKSDWAGGLLYRALKDKEILYHLPPELRAFIKNRSGQYKSQLYVDVMIEEVSKILKISKVISPKFEIEKEIRTCNLQEKRMVLDMLTYMPDEILSKTDRASMRYSLEVRCPLIDYRMIEESFKIPHKFKYHNFSKKDILKEITYEFVPKKLLDRPKNGFGVPLKKWLRTILKRHILRYAEPDILKRQGIFDADGVRQLILNQEKSDKIMYSSLLWSFYSFQCWYQYYIEDFWN